MSSSLRSKRLRGAIIGFGKVAQLAHLPAWRKVSWADIVAVVDPVERHRTIAASTLSGVRCYEDVERLLAEESLDFVDIATPPHLHGRLTLTCASRGLHVLCEKPMTSKLQELHALEQIVRRGHVAVVPVHNWRYAPIIQQALRVVRRRAFGKVQTIEWQVLRNEPARDAGGPAHGWRLDPTIAGGGIVVDHGWHAFYLVRALLGEDPEAAMAVVQARRFQDAQVEDTAHCFIRFPSATASVFLTWAANERRVRGTIVGEGGTLTIDEDLLILHRPGKVPQQRHFPEPLSASSQHPDWFAGTLTEFQAAIQDPQRRAAHLQEVRACLSLVRATYAQRQDTARSVTTAEEASLDWVPISHSVRA